MDLTLEKIYKNFDIFTEWEGRFKYIVELGKQLKPIPEEFQKEDYRVRGCVSRAWLAKDPENKDAHTFKFIAYSEAAIVRGLIKVIMVIFNNKSAVEILKTDLEPIFEKLDLLTHLSPNRANGFQSLVQKIKMLCIEDVKTTLS